MQTVQELGFQRGTGGNIYSKSIGLWWKIKTIQWKIRIVQQAISWSIMYTKWKRKKGLYLNNEFILQLTNVTYIDNVLMA